MARPGLQTGPCPRCLAPAAATCPDGFAGPACALCQTDDACRRSLRTATAACSRALTFAEGSQAVKSFACALPPDGLLGGLLQPGSLLVQCTPGSAACTIGFTVKSPAVDVACRASGCTFVNGAASLACASTTCSCPADATCGNNSECASAGWADGRSRHVATGQAVGGRLS